MSEKAIQDYYPAALSQCYGCGRLNEDGLQIKSHWDGEEAVAVFTPRPYHIAIPGFVYGGLIASIVDCHGTGTAAAAATQVRVSPHSSEHRMVTSTVSSAAAATHAAGHEITDETILRFVTASLHVNYLRPTPMGVPLVVRGKATEIKGRKVVVSVTVAAEDEIVVTGEVVAVQMPEHLFPEEKAD